MKTRLLVLIILTMSGCVIAPKQTKKTTYDEPEFSVDVTICRAVGESSKKSLIILPPTGGTNLIDRSYTKRFCNDGWDVYVLNDWSRPGETGNDLEFHQRAYTNSQRAMKLALERIKTPFIGVLGTSVGATYAAVAANTFERIDAVFFIVGGVSIPRVIVTSDYPTMVAFHKSRFERFKFENDSEYEKAIENVFHLEPTKLGDLHSKKDIGAVISTGDTTVPYETQKNLVEFFRPRTVLTFSSSHFWTVVRTWWSHTDEIASFFNESAAAALKLKN